MTTRSLYDTLAIAQKDRQSTGPFAWITANFQKDSPDACFVERSSVFMSKQYLPADQIDTESDLRNNSRPSSRIISTKAYTGPTSDTCKACKNCNTGLPCGCDHCKEKKNIKNCSGDTHVPTYTRLNKPCKVTSGININRFSYLCEDLQDVSKISSNDVIGTNTRLAVKDQFQPVRK